MYNPLSAYGGFESVDRILKLAVLPVPWINWRIIGSCVPPNSAVPKTAAPNVAGTRTPVIVYSSGCGILVAS